MQEDEAPASRKRPVRRSLAFAAAVIIVVVALSAIVLGRNAVALSVLRSAAHGLGYDVTVKTLDLTLGHVNLRDVRVVNDAREAVLDARAVDADYSLRDLLPGGKRLFGLTAVRVVSPRVTVIHHTDGTYNITLPPSAAQPPRAAAPPLDITLDISDARVLLIDNFIAPPESRRIALRSGFVHGAISPARKSSYAGGIDLVSGAGTTPVFPIRGSGHFDLGRGFAYQHWTAARLPVADLANFALSTHAVTVEAGDVRDLDVRYGTLSASSGVLENHLGVTGRLAGVRLGATALALPVRDAHGPFVVADDSVSVPSLDATLAGIALHARGALYHFAAPQLAFALTARGDLGRARALSRETAPLPLGGALALQGLAEGPASNPLVIARFDAPHAAYAAYRLDTARGLVALRGNQLDLIDAALRYGPLTAGARASISLQTHTQTRGYAIASASTAALPYAAAILPGVDMHATAAFAGRDARIAARGYVAGANGPDRLDAPFSIDAAGAGMAGPIVLTRRDGASVYARAMFDRSAGSLVALADVRRLSLLRSRAGNATLPGLDLPALPARLDATLDATLAGTASRGVAPSAGGSVHAFGSWGDLQAHVDGTPTLIAARGRLASSFERLAPFTGNLGGRGAIDVPFSLARAGSQTTLQIPATRFRGVSVRGIAVRGIAATVALLAGGAVAVDAATLAVGGARVVAQGRFGDGGHIDVSAGDVDLDGFGFAGVPKIGGRASIIGDVGGTATAPTATLLAALAGARYDGIDVGGDAGLDYDHGALHVDRATLTYGSAYAYAGGTVTGLAPGRIAPRYALGARLEDADIATLARALHAPLRYPEGTLEANLRVGGGGAAPTVAGEVAIPEGSLNGLYFSGGRAAIAAAGTTLAARHGRVTVGSTTLDFGATVSRAAQRGSLRAPRLDLADFNDYFDEAEVLAGTGYGAVSVEATPQHVGASADLGLRGVRYRRFEFGSLGGDLRTRGRHVSVNGALAGPNGRATLDGFVDLPASEPLRDSVRRSPVDLSMQIAGVDLGHVLPAAGLSLPLFGIVDATATVRGTFPALTLATRAELTHGIAARVPIDRFTFAAAADGGHGRITESTLAIPGLTAHASGTFGLRPDDRFALDLESSSPDIATLLATATGRRPDVGGSLTTSSHLTGTLAAPQLATTIDLTNVTYRTVTVPSVHTELVATRTSVGVRRGTVALPSDGSITFDGTVPLGGAGGATPIAFDFVPRHVDIAPYASLLSDKTTIGGLLDGALGVRGTLDDPLLSGSLSFRGGRYRSDLLRSGLSDVTFDLDFTGTTIALRNLRAQTSPGTISGAGTLALRDLRDPVRGLRAAVELTLAGVRLDAPKYYSGTIDGTLTARKRAAAPAVVGGDLTFTSGRIPYTALLPGGAAPATAAPALPNVAFNLGVTAGRDVRVQSGPVDIGATGMATLGGTLSAPALSGQFTATNGTVSLYRTFTVQNGSAVMFDPANGVTPTVDATAFTNIPDPPTDVLLHITGLATHLNLDFTSQPPYSKEQILGLLVNAQALGAVSGIAQTNGGSNNFSIAGVGEGYLTTAFSQRFLQPFTSKLGGALGLSDLNVNYNTTGSVSATARRAIGKNVSFVYGETFGGSLRQTSLGINVGNTIAGAQLTFFQTDGSNIFNSLTPFLQSGGLTNAPTNYTLQSIAPSDGSGFVFTYQRHYW